MTEQQNSEQMAELIRMKQEMVKIVYGSGYDITLDSGRVLTMTSLSQ